MLTGAPYKEEDPEIQKALKLAQEQGEPTWTFSSIEESFLFYDKPDGTIDAVVHPDRYREI